MKYEGRIVLHVEGNKMKKNIHPENLREIAFKDVTSGKIFVVKSTAQTTETIEHEGKSYPLFTVDTSSASHPFYTGARSSSRSTGRVERFNKKFGNIVTKKS